MKSPGLLVKTKKDKIGRTYHLKPLINNKFAVYLEKEGTKDEFEEKAILCEPGTLKVIGYID